MTVEEVRLTLRFEQVLDAMTRLAYEINDLQTQPLRDVRPILKSHCTDALESIQKALATRDRILAKKPDPNQTDAFPSD